MPSGIVVGLPASVTFISTRYRISFLLSKREVSLGLRVRWAGPRRPADPERDSVAKPDPAAQAQLEPTGWQQRAKAAKGPRIAADQVTPPRLRARGCAEHRARHPGGRIAGLDALPQHLDRSLSLVFICSEQPI